MRLSRSASIVTVCCGRSRSIPPSPYVILTNEYGSLSQGPPAKPGPGYELVPDLGYYKLHTSLVTWEEARNTCSQEGAHLAIPRSQKEVNVLLGLLSRHPKIQDGELNKYAFTGIHDQYSEGQFVDIFGNPADMTALKWFPGQPNDGGKALQNCIGLMREGKINDIYCHNKLPFLCEQKIQPAPVVDGSAKNQICVKGKFLFSVFDLYLVMSRRTASWTELEGQE
uniref:C-type lectin domain-containing protein n=1 Tax=Timema bartmani TaxID=61472 RepID=A0A7R9EUQ8_9NEOP|nr:unnamed protein product [Timema bartmani]